MKRLHTETKSIVVAVVENDNSPFPSGVFPLIEKVLFYILSIMYNIYDRDYGTASGLFMILMRARVLLCHLSNTQIAQKFIPLIQQVDASFWGCVGRGAIPLFSGLRVLNLDPSCGSGIEEGRIFQKMYSVERINLSGARLNLDYIKDLTNLRSLKMSDGFTLIIPNKECIRVFERLHHLSFDGTRRAQFITQEEEFINQIATHCTNLKSLYMPTYYPVALAPLLCLPSITKLSTRAPLVANHLIHLTRLEYLKTTKHVPGLTDAYLRSIAPTLRTLKIENSFFNPVSLVVSTNLQCLHISTGTGSSMLDLSMLTNLTSLSVIKGGGFMRLSPPSSIKSIEIY